MHKRGQVTIFIIIAVLLLMSVSVYMYLQREKLEAGYLVPALKEIPEAAKPVSNYVTDCLKQTARQALILVGDQGGYMNVDEFSINPIFPTEGEAVQFTIGSDLIIPYWWYLDDENDCEKRGSCTFATARPFLYKSEGTGSIEEQLENFVNENVELCYQAFDPFTAQGITVHPSEFPETNVQIAEDKVIFLLTHPMEVEKTGATYDLEQFFYEESINFKEIYEVATEIVNGQIEHAFLEKHVLNLISLYSGIDKPLPPMSASEIKMGMGTTWIKSEVKKQIKNNLLAPYIQLMRVSNVALTDRIPTEDSSYPPLADAVLNMGMIVPLEEEHPGMSATFSYLPFWEPYFDLGCDGELCMPQSINVMFIAFFGVQKYNFGYDLSFPVLVQIYVPEVFEGTGYTFKYFIEANLRNNEPLQAFDFYISPPDRTTVATNTLLCDQNQRTSGNIELTVTSGLDDSPIDQVHVSYHCGEERCTIGQTAQGTLTGKFPRCANGILSLRHPDYATTSIPLSLLDEVDRSFDLVLEPYRYINVTVRKHPLVKGADGLWDYNARADDAMRNKEEAIITLTRQKQTPYDEDLTVFINVMGNTMTRYNPCPADPANPTLKNEYSKDLRILPGTYDANVIGFSYHDIVIPEEIKEVGDWPFEEEVSIPEMVFGCDNPFPMSNAEYEIEIDKEKLDKNNEVTLYIPVLDLQAVPENRRAIEDLSALELVAEVPLTHRSSLRPKWPK